MSHENQIHNELGYKAQITLKLQSSIMFKYILFENKDLFVKYIKKYKLKINL